MSAPVWQLHIDLQARTATFTSGLADAARKAKESFGQIGDSAKKSGADVGHSSLDIRHSLGLVDNVIRGAHGMAMADLVRMYSQSAIVMGALPIAATVAGFALIGGIVYEVAQKFREAKEAQEKFKDSQTQFGTAVNGAFNGIKEKMLTAEIESDNLRKDHLGALKHQLELIDMQSMSELVQSFETVARAADQTLGDIKVSWYEFGVNTDGAKHALNEFKLQYEKLLSMGDKAGASGLLKGTLDQAQKVLDLQHKAQEDAQTHATSTYGGGGREAYQRYMQDVNSLKQYGVGISEKEVSAQVALVDALRSQLEIEGRITSLDSLNKGNARTSAGKKGATDAAKEFRKAFENGMRGGEDAGKLFNEYLKQSIDAVQQSEREKIAATREGSTERLQAIDEAIREEQSKQLTDTEYYKGLLVQRIALVRQMAEEEARLKQEAGRETAGHDAKMAELSLAALRQHTADMDTLNRSTDSQRAQHEIDLANAEYNMQMAAYNDERSALDTNAKDYENRLTAINHRQEELVQQHENKVTEIRETAEQNRALTVMGAESRLQGMVAASLTATLMGHQSFAKSMSSLGDQVSSGMMRNAMQDIMSLDATRERSAAKAARDAYVTGMGFPPPANLVMAPVLAAGAFAAVMAFNEGGLVPGIGNMDTVPAMLTPGEHVSDKSLTQGLKRMVDQGGPTNHYTVHVRQTNHVQTLDSGGFQRVLDKHGDTLQRHVENTLRKMNR